MRSDLIYDVGMHVGKDTEFYLRKGFSVVAIEANPALAAVCKDRLSEHMASGRLHVIEAAITDRVGSAKMYVCRSNSQWTTLSDEVFQDKKRRFKAKFDAVEVQSIDLSSILEQHGVPYYMKIDIEGCDVFCLEELQSSSELPKYISIEVGAERPYMELHLLYKLGYRQFKFVNQRNLSEVKLPDPPKEGSYVDFAFDQETSGPFGEETPGAWVDIHSAMLSNYGILTKQDQREDEFTDIRENIVNIVDPERNGWFDIHAKF